MFPNVIVLCCFQLILTTKDGRKQGKQHTVHDSTLNPSGGLNFQGVPGNFVILTKRLVNNKKKRRFMQYHS